MIIHEIEVTERGHLILKDIGGDREAYKEGFSALVSPMCVHYNAKRELEKYPEEKDAIVLTKEEALEKLMNHVYIFKVLRLHEVEEGFNKKLKALEQAKLRLLHD